jgi:hypothetical protein
MSLKFKKSTEASFSAIFLTATLLCATSHISLSRIEDALMLATTAAMTVVFPVPGGP